MKRRQKGKIAKNKFFSLIGSQRKHIKPDMPLIFNWEFFWENTNVFWKLKFPLSSSRRNSNIYKVAEQLFTSTIRCLLFCDLSNIFLLNLQIVYLILLLMSWELFRQKLAIMRKTNIMGVVFKLPRVSIWDAINYNSSDLKVPSIGSQRKRLKNTPFR